MKPTNSRHRFPRLVRLIVREGKLRHSGHNFEEGRRRALQEFSSFLPSCVATGTSGMQWKKWLLKNPFLRSWVTQAAFIKDSFRSKGSHLYLPGQNLCYIRNPKSASTALCYAVLSAHFPELKNFVLTPGKINFLADAMLHEQLLPMETKAGFFTVVRNPFARLVSVYREYFERHDGPFIYEDYLFGILRQDLSFKELVHILQVIPDRLKDQHLKPQHMLLEFYQRNKIMVTILKLDEPGTISRFLSPHGLTLEAINRSETDYDYRKYFDEDTLESVCQIYGKDISQFGYGPVYEEIRQLIKKGG